MDDEGVRQMLRRRLAGAAGARERDAVPELHAVKARSVTTGTPRRRHDRGGRTPRIVHDDGGPVIGVPGTWQVFEVTHG